MRPVRRVAELGSLDSFTAHESIHLHLEEPVAKTAVGTCVSTLACDYLRRRSLLLFCRAAWCFS